jgi:hypothetical protein
MPTKASKPTLPPKDLRDRQEGYGSLGTISGYPEYRDSGIWPSTPVRGEFELEPPETSDDREGGWKREGNNPTADS